MAMKQQRPSTGAKQKTPWFAKLIGSVENASGRMASWRPSSTDSRSSAPAAERGVRVRLMRPS